MVTSSVSELPQTSFAILGMLSFGSMSGYDLKQFADESIGYFYWSPAKSQIYAELRRLKNAGMVTEEHVEQENRPDKRVYALTGTGRETLAAWVGSPELEPDVFKSSLMLRVFFGKSGNPAALIPLLEQNLEHANQRLEQLKEIEERQKDCAPGYDPTFSLLTLRAGILFTLASIDWTKESMAILGRYQDADTQGDESAR